MPLLRLSFQSALVRYHTIQQKWPVGDRLKRSQVLSPSASRLPSLHLHRVPYLRKESYRRIAYPAPTV